MVDGQPGCQTDLCPAYRQGVVTTPYLNQDVANHVMVFQPRVLVMVVYQSEETQPEDLF